jgi:hypothetical protein
LHWTLHGRPELNVLHGNYTNAGPLSPNIAQNIFAAIVGSGGWTAYEALIGNLVVFTGVGVIDLRSPSNPEITSTGAAVPGTGGVNPLPDQVSLVVTLRTALTGRSHRGRVYTFGWVAGQMMPDGTANPQVGSAAKGFVDAVNSAMTAQGAPLAILSPALPERPAHGGGLLPAKPFEITPVTTTVVRDLIWDTNRRRQDLIRR